VTAAAARRVPTAPPSFRDGRMDAALRQLELAVRSRPRTSGVRPGSGDVRSLHVQEREDGVAEVCATVRRGQRMAAVALRLEGLGGRWTCTELSCV